MLNTVKFSTFTLCRLQNIQDTCQMRYDSNLIKQSRAFLPKSIWQILIRTILIRGIRRNNNKISFLSQCALTNWICSFSCEKRILLYFLISEFGWPGFNNRSSSYIWLANFNVFPQLFIFVFFVRFVFSYMFGCNISLHKRKRRSKVFFLPIAKG